MTFRASGIRPPLKAKRMKGTASAVLLVKMYAMNFLMLAYTARPSSTALTMEAKLSSARTMSAASFATSVPAIPIATPMSAFFSAGASFTPSPVTATTCPIRWSADTARSLCSGATRARITSPRSASSRAGSPIPSISAPFRMRGDSPRRMPTRRATLSAVSP